MGLGTKDAMQIDLLPNLPPSGGYESVLTAIDVFSQYCFAYPLADASAINVAKVIIDITTKHVYLPTTLITEKGTAFTSTINAEITQFWESHSNVQRLSTRKQSGNCSEHMHHSRHISRWQVGSIADNSKNISKHKFSRLYRFLTNKSIPWKSSIKISWITSLAKFSFREEQLQPDEKIIIPQDDLYTKS